MWPVYIHAVGTYAARANESPANLKEVLIGDGGQVLRRTNRLIDLALIGAGRCVPSPSLLPEACALYLATGQGGVADSALLVRQMIQDRLPPMPFRFINISCNTAGFYVSLQLGLGLHGNQMISTRDFPVEAVLQIAALELAVGHCEAALVGAVDECAWPLAEHRQRLGLPEEYPLGEGTHWFLLSKERQGALASIDSLAWPVEHSAIQPPHPGEAFELRSGHGAHLYEHAPEWLKQAPCDSLAVGYYDTNTAHCLAHFVQQAAAGAQLRHVNCGADGSFAELRMSRF